ncbi:flagellar biosynthesis, cell-distal portion of basal-body rod [Klebsiella pneumoniae]|uniref:hypothetical protein n=1 Tax=Klebsiella pneumoniae TaxID=573 RepID=UPI000E2AD887|nr:hypothetical protein [Klebsiella pneumoniae]SVL84474.1 flagellar biosynthesis, cell-distal portion of basal-body rod [Klebsiella pneumoniae]
MAGFDPALGSTSPAVLLDNVTRLDELVNGPPADVPDRAGDPLYSWRQIMAMVAAAIVEAQNSITAIGLPFTTLPEAQTAADEGKIPEGAVTWVRNIEDIELADEYKNIAGTLTATGRKLPSQQSIDKYFQVLPDGTFALMADNGMILAIDKNAVTRAVSLAVQDLISVGGASFQIYQNANGLFVVGDNGIPLALGPDGILRMVAANIGGVGFETDTMGVPVLFRAPNGIAGAVDLDGNWRFPGVVTDTLIVGGKKITGDGGGSMGTEFTRSDRYVDADGNIMPVITDTLKMSAWGSSSLLRYGADAAFSAMASSLGVTNWNNQGQGGETSFQIAARFGSVPFSLIFPDNTIPASGAVGVTCTQLPSNFRNSYLKAYSGTVGGVSGTLSWSSSLSSLLFTRATSGSPVVLTGATDFIPTLPESYRDGVVLLWMYKNDITNPEFSAEVTFSNVVKTFAHLSTLAKRCLVIGIFNDSSYSNTDYLNRVATLNSMMRAKFGYLYCDTQDYLCSAQVWVDTGITPTEQDLAMQAAGYKATSLSGDTLHLNTAASKAITDHVIKPKLISLGWYK